ncbi:MAG: cation-translocating P-type ATPase [Dehalococcoidia bacterium]
MQEISSPDSKGRRWHTMTASDVSVALDTGPHGLDPGQAEARLAEHGPNALKEVPPPGILKVFLLQFRSPLIYILLVAAVVTAVLREFIDASVIMAILALNAVIGATQERRAESSVRALLKLVSPRARVVRGGVEYDVESKDIVPGDVVLLESGLRVPADVRLWAVNNLHVDESLLTGESLPVSKREEPLADAALLLADRRNMAYAGSIVTTGRARAYVVETGANTELGTIASHLRAQSVTETPLQRRMAQFGRLIGVAVGVLSVLAFALGVAVGESATEMFLVAVALAVAAVPEGLPVVFTITLALGVRRMARRKAMVRRLPAVETLGSTTVIGSDKTGTLTENRMTVRELWSGGVAYRLEYGALTRSDGKAEALALAEHRPLYLALLAGVLSNEATLQGSGDTLTSVGDPTEAALLLAAADLGIEAAEARIAYRSELDMPFESERQFSAIVCRHNSGRFVFVKGAPERVLSMSSTLLTDSGASQIDPEQVHAAAAKMASRGLRVLATAYGKLDDDGFNPAVISGLSLLGLHGLVDPPRTGVREAIAGCREAGVRVVMITGDHAGTAVAIARELGIQDEAASVVTGADIEGMSDADLLGRVGTTRVYARTAPEHKLRIVQALRSSGEVVAITGDGVNDAPALRAADIGIAMGKGGTDVAREAADMVLADDNFVSIYAAVEEGRVTFENLRKVTFFLLSTGASSIIAILVAVAVGWPIPMVAAQLLWLNLVTNGLQDMALSFEPGEKGVLRRPPRPPAEGIVSAVLWERTLIAGAVMAAGTLLMFRWELGQSDSIEQARTVALTTMVLFQSVHVGNARSERLSAFAKSPFSNPFLFIATVAALLVHVGALYFPPAQFVLRVEPLGLAEWVRMAAVSLSVVVAVEIHKAVRRGNVGAATMP